MSWQDSLCRRQIDADRPYVADVSVIWPDPHFALDLVITTFDSVPVRNTYDQLTGYAVPSERHLDGFKASNDNYARHR